MSDFPLFDVPDLPPLAFPKPVPEPKVRKRIARSLKRLARKKAPPKLSKKMLPKLKRKLWSLFAPYARAQDGSNTCVSCGREGLEGSSWQAGHLFPAGSHNVLRFEPLNVHAQCYHCNINLGGNGAPYAAWFIARYGLDLFNRMEARSRVIKPWEPWELADLIAAITVSWEAFKALYAERYPL